MSKKCDRKNVHHRCPKSIGGSDDALNLSKVQVHKHTAWHVLFQNMTAQEIVAELNKYWIDPTFTVVLYQKFPSQLKMTG